MYFTSPIPTKGYGHKSSKSFYKKCREYNGEHMSTSKMLNNGHGDYSFIVASLESYNSFFKGESLECFNLKRIFLALSFHFNPLNFPPSCLDYP